MKKLILLWLAICAVSLVSIGYTYELFISPVWVVNAFAAYGMILMRKHLSHDLLIVLYAFSAIFVASLMVDPAKTLEDKFLLCAISAFQIWVFIKAYLALSHLKKRRFKRTLMLTVPSIVGAFAGSLLFVACFQMDNQYFAFVDYFLEQFATSLAVVCLLFGVQRWMNVPWVDYGYLIVALAVQYVISNDQIFYACMVLPLLMCYYAIKYDLKTFCWLIGLMTLICGWYGAMPLAGEYWSDAQVHMLSRISSYRLALGIYLIIFLFICELYARNKSLYLALQRVSFCDELTGLKNRHAFKEQIFIEGAVDKGCVILLDVDNFKKINDQYGHQMGDCVLVHLAKILKNCSPRASFISRWGGEEFLILLEGADLEQGKMLCETILERCEHVPFRKDQLRLDVSFSMGLAEFQQLNLSNYSTTLQHVDACLYQAKSQGKNQFVYQKIIPLAESSIAV
ncbi:GGDEF domain-containing protein [Acinetobacter sp. YH12045]|uniref:GGDEF domain-containing protein n=1 Tax=Acinetobacter sp. YH12045 TaxID=2601051 RepID=UPI0015D383E0|nr:GGDEF domain-containing protein [Acinetobacter sp. YH12045]